MSTVYAIFLRSLIIGSIALFAAVVPTAAIGDAPWSDPMSVSAPDSSADDPSVAIDRSRISHLAWSSEEGVI